MEYVIRIYRGDNAVSFTFPVDKQFRSGNDFRLMDCLKHHNIDPNEVIATGGSLAFGTLEDHEFTPLHTLNKGMIG